MEWDSGCLSEHLELLQSLSQLCNDDIESIGRVCRSTNQEHCFKSAFGHEAMEPMHRYYFEIKCVKGANFKIGIATEVAKKSPNSAFCDTDQGFAYFSSGQLRHDSKGSGIPYGEKFKQDDTIGVYVDLVGGALFFSKNGKVFAQNAFDGEALRQHTFYPAACCLSKNEMFELLEPQAED